jgi:5-oxoprolinase (ATP-hydrolysing)
MGLADQTALREASVELPLDEAGLQVAVDSLPAMRQAFEAAYLQRFSFGMPGRGLVIEAVTVEAIGRSDAPIATVARPADVVADAVADVTGTAAAPASAGPQPPQPLATVQMHCAADDGSHDAWRPAGLHQREALPGGACIDGPAVIAEANATTVVEPGWQAQVGSAGELTLRRLRPRPLATAVGTAADPVMLEVFNNLFMNIAEQMGLRLQNTAHSVNIKERLDFSCAVFDPQGQLIANAPHMPVHLGSMSESIKTVIDRNPAMQPGDVYVLNDPYHGGTHLPDVTVVTPVYLGAAAQPQFYVASRGHHADIGGITPGSMPPFSRSIQEEGVLLDNLLLVRGGVLQEASLRQHLASGRWPARNPDQTLADLRAQIAANEKGQQELQAMVAQWGLATVLAYMGHVQDNAEESVRRVITALHDGHFTLPMDNGSQIAVRVTVDAARREAVIDFTGTSAQAPDNFNAPKAVTMAAVLCVFRTLVDDDIPLNAGCLKPLRVIVPPGCLLNPQSPAAVVAGNVETSSCVTNALYGALGVLASSQPTMNNFTFGDDRHQYYETISGGSGAGPGFAGTSVVQTHMTNSRLTDPEVLESRFPVRLDSYAIRTGSGGAGGWPGGDGGVRRVRFLQPMTAAILSNGRLHGAFGAAGGSAGAPGINRVERADGRTEVLGYIGEVQMQPGDVFVIETPGGGGWGLPETVPAT